MEGEWVRPQTSLPRRGAASSNPRRRSSGMSDSRLSGVAIARVGSRESLMQQKTTAAASSVSAGRATLHSRPAKSVKNRSPSDGRRGARRSDGCGEDDRIPLSRGGVGFKCRGARYGLVGGALWGFRAAPVLQAASATHSRQDPAFGNSNHSFVFFVFFVVLLARRASSSSKNKSARRPVVGCWRSGRPWAMCILTDQIGSVTLSVEREPF